MAGAAVAFACPDGKRQKPKVGSGCSEGKRRKWEGDAQKAKGKSGKGMLNAFRHLSGGHLYIFYLLPFTFCLLPFTFPGVASVRNPKSKIENPKSCVGPSAILTGSRTRPSDWSSNARFGPVEDPRNNRRFATFTCALCVLQIWWLSPFTSPNLSQIWWLSPFTSDLVAVAFHLSTFHLSPFTSACVLRFGGCHLSPLCCVLRFGGCHLSPLVAVCFHLSTFQLPRRVVAAVR